MKISLCLIIWNELEGCKTDIPSLPLDAFDEVYAIDGGSTDGSIEYIKSHGIPVYIQPKKGLNAAYVHANRMSNYDAVVTFFPKGTLCVTDLLKFRPLLEQGNDIVIASRQIKGSRNEEDNNLFKPRKWCVRLLAYFIALLWHREGDIIYDVLHGVKGWKKLAFEKMDILEAGLSIDLEMVIRSYKLHLKRTEFPTVENSRYYGKTHFKLWPTGKKLLKFLWYEFHR